MKLPDHKPAQDVSRLGYLLSRYPAISHTFFLQEIRGLRALGLEIEAASINPPDRPLAQLSTAESEEFHSTFYLKSMGHSRALRCVAGVALSSPGVVAKAVGAALRLSPASVGQRLYSIFYVVEALILYDWIRRRRITHLHIHFGGAVAAVGMLAAVAAGIPYSLTIHGPDEFFDQESFHLRQKLESAAFVVAISHYCRSQLMRIAAPSHWGRFDMVRLGILPEMLPRQEPRTEHGAIRIVTVGRLVATKGPLLLLQAVERLRAAGTAVSLTMVGSGPELPALELFVREHALGDVVTMTGALNHDDALAEVAKADIFVLASFAEGIPVALMEAMALGVPCISTYIAGIPELIDHEHDGILVPAGSVDALADAIARLAADTELRHRFADAARAHVLRDYHLPDNLKQLADTFARRLATTTQP